MGLWLWRKRAAAALALGMVHFFLLLDPGLAQAFPNRSVRIIVPGPPGSTGDILTRVIAEKLLVIWHQPVVVENRTGAAGIIGSAFVAKAPADGHTLLMGHSGSHVLNVILRPRLPYSTLRDFAPVTMVATGPNVLVVHPSLPVASVKDLIALAKSRPHQLNYGSGGIGLGPHLAAERFNRMAGISMVHVPYQGLPPALIDLIAGQIAVMFPTIPVAMPHMTSGKVRPLGVTSAKRFALLPELPAIAESGLPGYEVAAWFGVFAPAGVPADVVAQISKDVGAVLELREVRTFVTRQGIEVAGTTPERFRSHIERELVRWTQVIREANIGPLE